eukprot:CAMPEP_0178948346 /NCGR_PEP_ID=MMETSP0789-20121207/5423_1 /TAXON_ID=3005 /ORGANISM="Rhizosolenia setigera, Strain CCMP 1694" /LENGTH=335 /DNA_ID=CAMNT_0020628705 /DNA_START=82 /DNA_END=1089 /DNA_ORIENTATION=+
MSYYNSYPNPNNAPPHSNNYDSGNAGFFNPAQHQQNSQYAPQQQQQQQQQSQGQPHQQQNEPALNNIVQNVFDPNTAAKAGMAFMQGDQKALQKIGESAAMSFLENVPGRVEPGFGKVMTSLRAYFAVDNRYVKKKILRVLFPFFSKIWKREELEPMRTSTNAEGVQVVFGPQYAPPVVDDNAPDLYLPSMSLITYGILCALLYGTTGEFTPEVLPDVTMYCFVTQILEVLLIRFGFYMMQVSVSILDLFSYTGYKYLGLCINMLIGLVGFGRTGYYVCFFWTASSTSYFISKVMANLIPKNTASTGPKRHIMVLVIGASQFATMWFVSQTKYLE